MKRGNIFLRGTLIFAAILIGYFAVFKWIEHRRVAKGPWTVTFTSESGVPKLIVNQSALNIRDVQIVFTDEHPATNFLQTVEFSQARQVPFDVPFGKCVFLDPLFLPGTVALEMFGHEIQLLPRMLTLDKTERPWRSGEKIAVGKDPSQK